MATYRNFILTDAALAVKEELEKFDKVGKSIPTLDNFEEYLNENRDYQHEFYNIIVQAKNRRLKPYKNSCLEVLAENLPDFIIWNILDFCCNFNPEFMHLYLPHTMFDTYGSYGYDSCLVCGIKEKYFYRFEKGLLWEFIFSRKCGYPLVNFCSVNCRIAFCTHEDEYIEDVEKRYPEPVYDDDYEGLFYLPTHL